MRARELAEAWPERWPRPDPATNARHASAVKPFAAFFRDEDIRKLEPERCRRFAERHPGALRYVITMCNDAVGDGLLAHNPFIGLRLPKKVNGAKRPTVPLIEEVERLIDLAPPPLCNAIEFSAFTGVRLSECRAFCLEGFEPPGRAWIGWQLTRDERWKVPKTGERRILVPSRAEEALRRTPPVRVRVEGRGHVHRFWRLSERHWNRLWGEVRIAAGVGFRWHDLRHFAATLFLDAGATIEDVAVQLGCSVEEVRRTYGHPDPDLALDRLQDLIERRNDGEAE